MAFLDLNCRLTLRKNLWTTEHSSVILSSNPVRFGEDSVGEIIASDEANVACRGSVEPTVTLQYNKLHSFLL